MDVQIDFPRRIQRIREYLDGSDIDLLLATRGKSVIYIGGAFIPWRSVALPVTVPIHCPSTKCALRIPFIR